MSRPDPGEIIAAAKATAEAPLEGAEKVTRLVTAAETLGAVLARIALGAKPRLLTVIVTALVDVIRPDDALAASPAADPFLARTDNRSEVHTAIEIRDGDGRWLAEVELVWTLANDPRRQPWRP
jgi:hypothetical protein